MKDIDPTISQTVLLMTDTVCNDLAIYTDREAYRCNDLTIFTANDRYRCNVLTSYNHHKGYCCNNLPSQIANER